MSADDSPAYQFNYTQDHSLTVPRRQQMVVDRADWRRIRRTVETLGDQLVGGASTWSHTAYGSAIGIAVTLLSLLATTADVEPWLKPTMGVALLFALAFAICFQVVGSRERSRITISAQAVCLDMDEVQSRCEPPDEGATERAMDRRSEVG